MATLGKKKKIGYAEPVFREILICSKKELAPFGTVFVLSPENYEQERLGILFGIFKILDLSSDSSYIVNLLTSVIKKEYFSRPERPAEESFEASLRKANLALAELARHGSTKWAGKISFAGGVIEKNNLHFSHLGETTVFLIRAGQIASISQDLDEGKTAEPHPLKTFTDISSGKIEKGDKIIFTTSDLLDIFSPEELRHNAARYSTEEFSGLVEASLHGNAELGGAIIIDLLLQAKIKARFESIRREQPVRPETATVAEATVKKNGSDSSLSLVPKKETPVMSEITAPLPENKQKDLYIKEDIDDVQEVSFAAKIFSLLKTLYHSSFELIVSFFRKSIDFARRLKIKEKMFFLFREKVKPGHLMEKITGHSRYLAGQISRIETKKKKIYSLIILAVVLIFIVGLILYGFFSNKSAPQPADQPAPETETVSEPAVLDDIQVKPVLELETLVDLAQKTQTLVMLDESLFSIPEKSQTILKINPDSKAVEESSGNLNVGNFKLITSMPNLNALFILTDDQKIVSFTPINRNFQENGIALPPNLSAVDIKTFLTYLYFLDPAANQVYRYPRAEGGFGERQNWLQSSSDIKGALSFAVNDDLYVASASEITAYLQGREDPAVTFEKTNVPLKIDKIYSAPGMENIYALDNKNHRVVQYSKNGKIVSQFWNASISNITDFVSDEASKSVFLLQDKKILKLSLE